MAPFAFPPGNIRGQTPADDILIMVNATKEAARGDESAGSPGPTGPTKRKGSCPEKKTLRTAVRP